MKAGQAKKRRADRFGRHAETWATLYLFCKGFRPMAARWRGRRGEIDLIVRRGKLTVFVEIKARQSVDEARHAISPNQRARIIAAAEEWLARAPQGEHQSFRFDALLLAPWRWPVHIKDAFRP